LRQLDDLKSRDVITPAEYQEKREAIIARWIPQSPAARS
jgi:hypothetical protein